jgi:hypothetical protein
MAARRIASGARLEALARGNAPGPLPMIKLPAQLTVP